MVKDKDPRSGLVWWWRERRQNDNLQLTKGAMMHTCMQNAKIFSHHEPGIWAANQDGEVAAPAISRYSEH